MFPTQMWPVASAKVAIATKANAAGDDEALCRNTSGAAFADFYVVPRRITVHPVTGKRLQAGNFRLSGDYTC